jgi:hypothetical protein
LTTDSGCFRAEFYKFKHDQATAAVNTRSGKPLLEKEIEMYEAQEAKKVQEVITVRLENIKLKNKLKKKEMQLKQKASDVRAETRHCLS